MSTNMLRKIQEESKSLDDGEATVEDMQVLFGLTLFASRVQRVPIAQFYPVVKFMRRRLSATPYPMTSFTLARLWPSVKPEWKHLITTLLTNPWTRHVPAKQHELVMVTDASTKGWGAVIFDEGSGEVSEAKGYWNAQHQCSEINELEMTALAMALDAFEDRITHERPLLILMDNSSSVHALSRGAAHAYRLNREAMAVLQRLPSTASVKVGYVESEKNPADAASRGLDTDLSQLPSDLWSLGRRLAGSSVQVTVPSRQALQYARKHKELNGAL